MSIFDRKKKKDIPSADNNILELFTSAMKEATENNQKQRLVLLSRQYVWKSNYGIDPSNPIISNSIEGTTAYLRRLCTPDGKKFSWSGYTSLRAAVHGLPDVGEDKYTLYLDGQPYMEVYFVPYIGIAEFPPAGLCFSDDIRDWNKERFVAERADKLGVDRDTAKRIMALEAKEKAKEDLRAKKIQEAGREISHYYPGVIIEKEIKNPLFETLFDLGVNPTLVYEFVHSSQLFTRKKQVFTGAETRIPTADYYHQILQGVYHKELEHLNSKIKMFTCQDEVAGAKEMGVDLNTYRRIHALEYAALKEDWRKQEYRINDLARQAVELKKQYPSFCIEEELQNRLFVKLIDKVSLLEAYEVIHFSDYFEMNSIETSSVIDAEPEQTTDRSSSNETDEKLFCRKCGKQIPVDSIFCSYCGTKVLR